MNKLINFNAGPAALPASVLNIIHRELFNWQNTGISILETGHRTPEFTKLGDQLEASVRRILQVPNHFSVLFLPGGAQVQFAMVTMNLVRGFKYANYIETGHWSARAMQEAKKYIQVHTAASSKEQQFTTIPALNTWDIKHDAAFLHFTDNETIGGVEFQSIPDIKDMILVSDMSSNIFTRPIDFSKIACVYACAQKNFGISGTSLVIIRRDLLDKALPETPSVFHYASQDKNGSVLATPSTFSWYVACLVLDWLEQAGGIQEMKRRSLHKSQLLYSYLDSTDFYQNNIESCYRSRMNVPFTLSDPAREADFFLSAQQEGLLNLAGHRSVGGIRASLYNTMTLEDVNTLIGFLKHFSGTR